MIKKKKVLKGGKSVYSNFPLTSLGQASSVFLPNEANAVPDSSTAMSHERITYIQPRPLPGAE